MGIYCSELSTRSIRIDGKFNHPCCWHEDSHKIRRSNYVQNIEKIKILEKGKGNVEKLIICGNLEGKCTIIDESNFENTAAPNVEYKQLVSEIRENPGFIKVIKLKDSSGTVHDLLYSAKTNLYGTDICKNYHRTQPKNCTCSNEVSALVSLKQRKDFTEVLRVTELSKDVQPKLEEICPGSSAIDPDLGRAGMRINGAADQRLADQNCVEFISRQGTMRYTEVFTAFDKSSKMEWLYYVYDYMPPPTNDFDNMPKSNFRIGRACSADIYFSNIGTDSLHL